MSARLWIEHDGLGCPFVIGTKVDVRIGPGSPNPAGVYIGCIITAECVDPNSPLNGWIWRDPQLCAHVLAYRRHDSPTEAVVASLREIARNPARVTEVEPA